MPVASLLVGLTGRLVVTGDVPARLRGRPLLLAANHIGNFDVLVLVAACRRIGVAPRFMATGGLFDAPVLGPVMRRCGHVRVNRGKDTAGDAIGTAVSALGSGAPVLVYPEGRISLDPGLWPERGKTGVARIALASRAPVVPVSQWGAHEAVCWGTLRIESRADLWILFRSWFQAMRRRPTFRVHFGHPVELSGLESGRPGDAVRARDRIMRAISRGLRPLRHREPLRPAFHDGTRPVTGRSPWSPEADRERAKAG
ncbi:lysophospholipid acyltransferase family protein [Actinoalloteichus caeruleus]|uniref:lysophospholipid acyltransferase family protein n=1 Tax=Actinoalloteichus cyanogriseus TaxID=2893586 RepID=UPI003BB94BC0